MTDRKALRVQVREDISAHPRVRVEVLDPEGNVLGDLVNVVPYDGITYKIDTRGVSILTLEIAVERASIDALEVAGYNIVSQVSTLTPTTTTPFDDPIVQACIDHGGHFWPDDAPENEPPTRTRCWFNPGWKAGKLRNEHNIQPIKDEPRG